MPGRSTVTTSELERMRLSVMDVKPSTELEQQRLMRKKMSDDRITRWPNTLDNQRKQKERARAEREAKIEAARQKPCKKWLRGICAQCQDAVARYSDGGAVPRRTRPIAERPY